MRKTILTVFLKHGVYTSTIKQKYNQHVQCA